MKIGIVYTGNGGQLVRSIEGALREVLPEDTVFLSYADESIIHDVRDAGYVYPAPAARLIGMYAAAIQDGVDIIYNCCSSVGEVADNMQDFAKYTGIPIVRVDEEMCLDAVRRMKRIAVMATLASTLEPTKRTLLRKAREINKAVELLDILVDVYGLEEEAFKAHLIEAASNVKDDVDAILLAQGSMAHIEADIQAACGKPVFSSPRYGAQALHAAARMKGLL